MQQTFSLVTALVMHMNEVLLHLVLYRHTEYQHHEHINICNVTE